MDRFAALVQMYRYPAAAQSPGHHAQEAEAADFEVSQTHSRVKE